MKPQFKKIPENYTGIIYNPDNRIITRFENLNEVLNFRLECASLKAIGYYYILDLYPEYKIGIDHRGGVFNHPEKDHYTLSINLTSILTRNIYNLNISDYEN